MKIDVTQAIKGLDGKPLMEQDPDGPEGAARQMTVGTAFLTALTAILEEDRNLSGEKKMKRYKIGLKIVGEDEVDLEIEEAAEVKMLVGKVFGPAVVGPLWDVLEGVEEKIEDD